MGIGIANRRRTGTLPRGLAVVEVLVVIAVLAVLASLALAAVSRARGSARSLTCAGNLRNLAVAVENYVGTHGCYPFGIAPDESPWMRILPFMGEEALYDRLRAEPLNSRNLGAASRTDIAGFLCPERGSPVSDAGLAPPPVPPSLAGQDLGNGGTCNYAPCGGTMLGNGVGDLQFGRGVVPRHGSGTTKPAHLLDGFSATMLAAEVLSGVEARRQANPEGVGVVFQVLVETATISAAESACRGALAAATDDNFGHPRWDRWADYLSFGCLVPPGSYGCAVHIKPSGWGLAEAEPAGVLHDGIVNAAFCDGSVHALSKDIDLAVWRALGTVAGGESVSGAF